MELYVNNRTTFKFAGAITPTVWEVLKSYIHHILLEVGVTTDDIEYTQDDCLPCLTGQEQLYMVEVSITCPAFYHGRFAKPVGRLINVVAQGRLVELTVNGY